MSLKDVLTDSFCFALGIAFLALVTHTAAMKVHQYLRQRFDSRMREQ